MEYPVTTEMPFDSPEYNDALAQFYDDWANRLAEVAATADVIVLCEGDPFFYGSFMHLHTRLEGRAEVEVIPGITGMTGCWNAVGTPFTWGDDVLSVLMATLPEAELITHMQRSDAMVIMKTGRNLPKVRAALETTGRLAGCVAGRTWHHADTTHRPPCGCRCRRLPLFRHCACPRPRPPSRNGRPRMSGWLAVAGLGPGDENMVTPEVRAALAEATDVIGYFPYVARVAPRDGLTLHGSDNRVEIDRADHALRLASEGAKVVIVSSGDPGVFAMASALFEALEKRPDLHDLDIKILPGITAMLAAAAHAGAPLGHDFCAINLSDNLKPWPLVEHRLRLAAQADFAMGFYNPRSASRPHQFARALEILLEECGPDRLITFARAVSTPEERIQTVTLAEATPEMADMRTVVIVGNSATRRVGRFVYTPRSAG